MKKAFQKIFGDPSKKKLKSFEKKVAEINEFEPKLKKLSDKDLRAKTEEFKKSLKSGKTLDHILPEAFAVVREASRRSVEMRHFDVQLIGGMVLHNNSVAEMKTGEGKTLVATLPMYLNALSGQGAHLVTVNDYLAQRDAGWMGEIYDFLGLSIGVIIANESFIFDKEFENKEHDDPRLKHLRPVGRKAAYDADITYGTNNEFGFDYLRDNMVREVGQLRQRKLHFAIVDEVDSILIDEARTPLIISAPATSSGSSYGQFAAIAKKLNAQTDMEIDEKRRSVALNDDGVAKVQKLLGVENLYAPDNMRLIYHLDQSLKAEYLFKKDKDYVVSEDNEVIIVDEFTGRLMHGRRYNEGLHQAIEAKEGVEVLQESMTLATISFQNYFRLYEKLAGMTGTAKTEEEEFYQIYKLDVVEIPTNKTIARLDLPDKIFRTQAGKFKAIVNEVKELHKKGQPVLLGTASIEKNEVLSAMLKRAGVKHNVLNAKNNEGEAAVVAKAGQKGAVTLATNIAGRGTDIVLGDGVVELGGLFVLGSERHEARRIDNQLRGRSGRQGDKGTTQFFVSAEDDLMRIFGGERVASLMSRMGVDEETPIENKTLSKALEAAQKKVESHNFDSRKHVVQYDDVMNRHRKAIYSNRKQILIESDVSSSIKEMIGKRINAFEPNETDNVKDLVEEMNTIFSFEPDDKKKLLKTAPLKLTRKVKEIADKKYEAREKAFTPSLLRQIEREIYLQVLDNLWMQHLENMSHLREGINWRSVGQKDPLVEYRREGQVLFEQMQVEMESEVVRTLFHASLHIHNHDHEDEVIETELTKAAKNSIAEGPQKTVTGKTKIDKKESKIERDQEALRPKPNKKDSARKKKKQQRKNKKKSRK